MTRRRPIYVPLFTVSAGLYLLSLRYLLTIQLQTVLNGCRQLQAVGDGYTLVFSPDLLPGALLPFLPSLLLLTAGFVLSVIAALKGWFGELTPRQGAALGFTVGGCTLLTGIWLAILPRIPLDADAAANGWQYAGMRLCTAEFMEWSYYKPFGFIGSGIRVTPMLEQERCCDVKYILLLLLTVWAVSLAAALLKKQREA